MGRPKSTPEQREAATAKRREYQRQWARKNRAKATPEQTKPKRGRPRDPKVDMVALAFALARLCGRELSIGGKVIRPKERGAVNEIAAALAEELDIQVKANDVSQAVHRVKKTKKR
jgi:hypothetical protein